MLPVLVEATRGTIRSGRRGARRRALDIYQGRFEVTAQNTSTITPLRDLEIGTQNRSNC
jgi:hypothetical protein